MKTFAPKPLDLSAEVETLSGDKVTLIPRIPRMSGAQVSQLVNTMTELEDPRRKGKDAAMPVAAEEMALVYDKDAKWFATELDYGTLREVIFWIGKTLGEFGKGDNS